MKLIAAIALVLVASQVMAADTILPAAQTLILSQDLILSGNDNLEISGTAEKPCTLEGNNHEIKTSGNWTGHIKTAYCIFKDLGKPQAVVKVPPSSPGGYPTFKIADPDAPAVELNASGNADINFDHCTFDQCNAVHLRIDGNSTLEYRHTTFLENAIYPVSEMPTSSVAALVISGNSPAKKYFQGNRVNKGECQFHCSNLLIGGDRDEDTNFIVGIRAKLDASGEGTIIRGNYIHVNILHDPRYAYWSQVSTFTSGKGTLAEHNVIRDGEWIVQFVEGEFRYNIICDANDHNLMRNGSVGSVHHNIFFIDKPPHGPGEMLGAVSVIYPPKDGQTGFELYNNVFDGCDIYGAPGLTVGSPDDHILVKSVRNNVFCNFKLTPKQIATPNAMILGRGTEALLYADYNCFFNPLAAVNKIYDAGVKGKTIRKDDGFAKHDLPVDGDVNAQVDPKFKGPLPREFGFKDEDILSGKVTVSQMLAHFREIYTPADGSPLIGAGDPADGPNSYIGAVGVGKDAPKDQFGKFGQASAQPGK